MTTSPRHSQWSFLSIWIVISAICNCAGWILSAIYELNLAGYAAVFAITLIAFALASRHNWRAGLGFGIDGALFRTFRYRFRRGLPLAFLILFVLSVLGGVLYAPSNYDALSYRLPRILHWLAEGRWHWIHSDFPRLNVRAAGFEWLSAPLIAFTRTDRLLFLINAISCALLPGLVFSLFRRLGVKPRVAWAWMWIIPTGYCFLLQAGSIANDLFAAVYALAALDFALRARKSGSTRDLALSILSAALLTGAKGSNLPLLLPWVLAVGPALKNVRRQPTILAFVLPAALLCSFLPTAILNWHYCGDWSGAVLEKRIELVPHIDGAPTFRIAVNSVWLVVQNLAPPVFPFENQWEQHLQNSLPAALTTRLQQNFEYEIARGFLGELQTEERGSLGLGVSGLLIMSMIAAVFYKRGTFPVGIEWQRWLILTSPFVALTALFAKSFMSPTGRLSAPYYALLIPIFLLAPAQERIVRSNWWRNAAFISFWLAGILVVASPARPLWPSHFVLSRLNAQSSPNAVLRRIGNVYSVYSDRWDSFASLREKLPPDATTLGLVSIDAPEASLWRPFGSRQIIEISPASSAEELRAQGIHYILMDSVLMRGYYGQSVDDWADRKQAEIVWKAPLQVKVSQGPVYWYLLRIKQDPQVSQKSQQE